jgi:hypothetical protein
VNTGILDGFGDGNFRTADRGRTPNVLQPNTIQTAGVQASSYYFNPGYYTSYVEPSGRLKYGTAITEGPMNYWKQSVNLLGSGIVDFAGCYALPSGLFNSGASLTDKSIFRVYVDDSLIFESATQLESQYNQPIYIVQTIQYCLGSVYIHMRSNDLAGSDYPFFTFEPSSTDHLVFKKSFSIWVKKLSVPLTYAGSMTGLYSLRSFTPASVGYGYMT